MGPKKAELNTVLHWIRQYETTVQKKNEQNDFPGGSKLAGYPIDSDHSHHFLGQKYNEFSSPCDCYFDTRPSELVFQGQAGFLWTKNNKRLADLVHERSYFNIFKLNNLELHFFCRLPHHCQTKLDAPKYARQNWNNLHEKRKTKNDMHFLKSPAGWLFSKENYFQFIVLILSSQNALSNRCSIAENLLNASILYMREHLE